MFNIKKKLEKLVVNTVMDTMDSALNIAETICDHPLADKIGQIVKDKTAKKENDTQESIPEESGYIHLTNINVEEQTEQVQVQSNLFASQTSSIEDESEEDIHEEYEYVRLTNINTEEQSEPMQASLMSTVENEPQDTFSEEYEYVRLTDIKVGEQTKQQAQSPISASQMSSVPPMPENSGMPPMPGAVPQVSYMIGVNGQQLGPCDWNQLQQMVQQGQLTQQTYVWKQGMPQWQLAGEVMELVPLFQGKIPDMPPMPHM